MKPPTKPPETEVRAERRRYNSTYKARILAEVEAITEPGEVGALLRREGLHHSHLSRWRAQRSDGNLEGKKPGRKSSRTDPVIARLERENRRLTARLERAEKIIEVQKKLSEILGIELKPLPQETDE